MRSFLRPRHIAAIAAISINSILLAACSDSGLLTAPDNALQSVQGSQRARGVELALAAQERHTNALLNIRGVIGTAVGLNPSGRPVVQVFVEGASHGAIPGDVDGIETAVVVSGRIMALSDPTLKLRPAPLGYSVGHPLITAGSVGFRVTNSATNTFILSNNHVLANSNASNVGDPILQPGAFDGGTLANDQIGTLAAFKPIVFTSNANNTMDAAIALVNAADVGNSTPADDGYGAPSGIIFGDANADGTFDNINLLLGLNVQKYGRTTKLTKGSITGVNATMTICYEVTFIFCTKSARFVQQLIIGQAGFSDGGDSGSGIVTDDAGLNPVALLFAGSATQTIANRIDLVLNNFGVRIDNGGEPPPPPDPLTDVAVISVTAPGTVTIGGTANVSVVVRNVGNQNVTSSFAVLLEDLTAGLSIGSQNIAALNAGASTTLTFPWNTTGAALGSHTLRATHQLIDDNAANNAGSTSVSVSPPSIAIHSGNLDAFPMLGSNGSWSAVVEVTVHDANHNPINGAVVRGAWSRNGLASDECTTGEGGGNGTCIFLFPGLKKTVRFVDFTVNSVTLAGHNYQSGQNHDPDGSSNGTIIRVVKP